MQSVVCNTHKTPPTTMRQLIMLVSVVATFTTTIANAADIANVTSTDDLSAKIRITGMPMSGHLLQASVIDIYRRADSGTSQINNLDTGDKRPEFTWFRVVKQDGPCEQNEPNYRTIAVSSQQICVSDIEYPTIGLVKNETTDYVNPVFSEEISNDTDAAVPQVRKSHYILRHDDVDKKMGVSVTLNVRQGAGENFLEKSFHVLIGSSKICDNTRIIGDVRKDSDGNYHYTCMDKPSSTPRGLLLFGSFESNQ